MYVLPSVLSAKCPFGQMSVGQISVGEMSISHLSGHGLALYRNIKVDEGGNTV